MRTLFNCSIKIHHQHFKLVGQKFQSIGNVYNHQRCCEDLTISSHQCSEHCQFPDWRECCTLYVCVIKKYWLFIIPKTPFCNQLETIEPHNVRTSCVQVIMLEIFSMFTVKQVLKIKLPCITELGYNYLKCIKIQQN